eukprot:13688419-Ditylum_brightwellii.AAC.1
MRAADERPPAKPPRATPASTAHLPHSHPLNHTPIIIVNQENQTKDLHQLHHLPIHKVYSTTGIEIPPVQIYICLPFRAPTEDTRTHIQPIIALWHLLLVLLNLHATLHHFNYLFILLLPYAAVLQSGQV